MFRKVAIALLVTLLVCGVILGLRELSGFNGLLGQVYLRLNEWLVAPGSLGRKLLPMAGLGIAGGVAFLTSWMMLSIPQGRFRFRALACFLVVILGASATLALYGILFQPVSSLIAMVLAILLTIGLSSTSGGKRRVDLHELVGGRVSPSMFEKLCASPTAVMPDAGIRDVTVLTLRVVQMEPVYEEAEVVLTAVADEAVESEDIPTEASRHATDENLPVVDGGELPLSEAQTTVEELSEVVADTMEEDLEPTEEVKIRPRGRSKKNRSKGESVKIVLEEPGSNSEVSADKSRKVSQEEKKANRDPSPQEMAAAAVRSVSEVAESAVDTVSEGAAEVVSDSKSTSEVQESETVAEVAPEIVEQATGHSASQSSAADGPGFVEQSNACLREAAQFLIAAGGCLDDSGADCVRVFFGLFGEDEAHATNACLSALQLSERLERKFGGSPIMEFGIALNSGPVQAGVFDSGLSSSFRGLGSDIDFTRRLSLANLTYGTRTLLGAGTHQQVADSMEVRPMDMLFVPEAQVMFEVCELLAPQGGLNHAELNRRDSFWKGVISYREGDYAAASDRFEEADPGDGSDRPLLYYRQKVAQDLRDAEASTGGSGNQHRPRRSHARLANSI